MDSLKKLLAAKKAEKDALLGEQRPKYVRASEVEEARLKRLREEEEQERQAQEKRRRTQHGTSSSPLKATPGAPATNTADADATTAAPSTKQSTPPPQLPRDVAIRRLRALGQPATLFGEDDDQRLLRLQKMERDVALVDEARGGQQENFYLEIKRQEKLKKGSVGGEAGKKADKKQKDGEATAAAANGATTADGEGDDVAAAFARAAAAIAAQRAEEAMPTEERIAKWMRRWCDEWGADLEARPDHVKASGAGVQAQLVYKQSMSYMEPLYERLKRRQVDDELVVGLWMMCQAVQSRNYLHANDIYLRLAIGNSAWPIGVTQVGIHERSAREKISHVMNATGQAHIMNDEATRKYLQAIKRLVSNMQRLYPTDPSRSIDFNVHGDNAGRGAAGGGSDKLALLAAEERGESTQLLGLPAAPHYLDRDGSVRIPPKWENVLAREREALARGGHVVGEAPKTPPRPGKTPPRTPPQD